MAHDYDLIVLGSGPGGYVAAIRAAQLGLKTAVVEKDPQLGGTCLHRGCIPTKALLHTASVLDQVKKAGEIGVDVTSTALDMAKTHAYKNRVVTKNAKGVAFLMRKNKVDVVHGFGRLTGADEVSVEGDGVTRTMRSRFILLATGSVVRELPHAQTDGSRIVSSDHLLQLERVPRSLAVLGAGAVGCEFASIFRSFGSEVTLIEMLPRILPIEDEEVSAELARLFRKRGITVHTNRKMTAVTPTEAGVRIALEHATEGAVSDTIEAEMLLVAIGRAPVSGGLGFEAQGIELDRGYVQVNETMQTSVPHIYAIGDLVATPWLAHVASSEGMLAVEHMAGQPVRPIDYDRVPSCTYCDPEVASVGLSEAKARQRGLQVETGVFPLTALGKAAILQKTEGFVKVVRDPTYDELLGVHIIGAHATDLIAEACVALQVESTTEELFRTMHAHPTLSEAVMEAAHAAVGHAIHT